MITIPRALARDLLAVARRLAAGGQPPAVELAAGPDGLAARCRGPGVVAECRLPGVRPPAALAVPPAALAACRGRAGEVTFAPAAPGWVAARWARAGLSHAPAFPAPATPPGDAPDPPAGWAPNPPHLLAALHEAGRAAAAAPGHFATHRVLLRGPAGEVVGTDARRLFAHRGFRFPWPGDALVPRTGVFGARPLAAGGAVAVGRTDTHLWVRAGPWAVALEVDANGRFPDVDAVFAREGGGGTALVLDPADRAGLAAALPYLPGAADPGRPVTLDLGGPPAVRAATAGGGRPAEVALARSRVDGPPVRLATDRGHLLRALRLGFSVVRAGGPARPLACGDGARRFVWMPLWPDRVVGPAPGALRLALPAAGPEGLGRPDAEPAGGLAGEAAAVRVAARELLGRVRALAALAAQAGRRYRLARGTLAFVRRLRAGGG